MIVCGWVGRKGPGILRTGKIKTNKQKPPQSACIGILSAQLPYFCPLLLD